MPDAYTDIGLPQGQVYLLTSDWRTDRSQLYDRGCNAAYSTQNALNSVMPAIPPATDPSGTFFQASPARPLRFQFWYQPEDATDIYVNRAPAHTISGQVDVQARGDAGVNVAAGSFSTQTAPNGGFNLLAIAGPQTVVARLKGYLTTQTTVNISTLVPGVTLPPTQLQGGDANGNNQVDLGDLVIVAANYGQATPPGDTRSDINGNVVVDLPDLAMVGNNYGMHGPTSWGIVQQKTDADKRAAKPTITLVMPDGVKAGEEFTVAVRVTGAVGLSAAEVGLVFDPKSVELVAPGASGDAGDLFDAQRRFTALNQGRQSEGRFDYAATQLSGGRDSLQEATLVTVRLRALRDGKPDVSLARTAFADAGGALIEP